MNYNVDVLRSVFRLSIPRARLFAPRAQKKRGIAETNAEKIFIFLLQFIDIHHIDH